jgi:hypothetical protein
VSVVEEIREEMEAVELHVLGEEVVEVGQLQRLAKVAVLGALCLYASRSEASVHDVLVASPMAVEQEQ